MEGLSDKNQAKVKYLLALAWWHIVTEIIIVMIFLRGILTVERPSGDLRGNDSCSTIEASWKTVNRMIWKY